jgi:hypothetical protein
MLWAIMKIKMPQCAGLSLNLFPIVILANIVDFGEMV